MRGRWLLILAGVIVAVLVVVLYFCDFSPGDKVYYARSQQSLFLKACQSYRLSRENGTYPVSLSELVAPTDGRKPLVDGGAAALFDPWGKPYCYAVADTPAGQELYVWCAREEGGKLCGFGVRLTPDGKTRRFTIADD